MVPIGSPEMGLEESLTRSPREHNLMCKPPGAIDYKIGSQNTSREIAVDRPEQRRLAVLIVSEF